jgi:hypothetical protein
MIPDAVAVRLSPEERAVLGPAPRPDDRRHPADPARFILYEIWADAEDGCPALIARRKGTKIAMVQSLYAISCEGYLDAES